MSLRQKGWSRQSTPLQVNPWLKPASSLLMRGRPFDREAQQEQQPEYIYVLIDNLIEILLHLGEDMDAYENMISYFDRVIEYLLEQKEVGEAVALLKSTQRYHGIHGSEG